MEACQKSTPGKRQWTRRQFIKSTAAGAAAVYVAPALAFGTGVSGHGAHSRVVSVRHRSLIDPDERINVKHARRSVDEALLLLTQKESIKDAWMQIFPNLTSKDTIGLKVNLASRKCPTHPEIAYAIAASLIEATGMNPNNVMIWDRSTSELEHAGYTINHSDKGVRCFGTIKKFSIIRWLISQKQNDSDGIGYDEDQPVDVGMGMISHLSRILTRMNTYLINVPVLKDHNRAGITLSLKNHYGTIDNPHDYHENCCDPFIAKINAAFPIKDKTRLIICDAAYGVYDGGPLGAPQWKPKAILASTDPVALDYTGMQMINAQRKKNDLDPVTARAVHVKTAQKLGVGTCNPKKIVLKKTVLS